ncbi:hypothetical protein RJ640_020080 [Escallonia rubra]|uniref:Neprosin PEP catalytic domain-containing protein n=1 Tax=Escallonia rubra TaxID=112253 RepID=A0AA88UE85_9ASTE|nr:hypothetical protein RJ640_020080 [Escallonia rubra]
MASSSSTSIVAATGSSLVTSTHTFSVKLTSKNYLAWKTQFLPILNYQNLHGHIDGASSPPPKTAVSPTAENLLIPNPEYEAWFKKDQLLLSCLTKSSTTQLYIELQELKKNDLSISEYLHMAKSLSDELSAAGKPVSPAEFNAIIYRNIGSDYHSIITALNLRQEPVSFYELHGHRYVPRQQNQSPRNNNFSNRNFNASANYSNVAPPLNWFPDTAANYHLTPDINALNAVNEYMGNDQLHVGNGQGLQITHTGPSEAGIYSLRQPKSLPVLIMRRWSGFFTTLNWLFRSVILDLFTIFWGYKLNNFNSDGILLTQEKYLEDLLKETHMGTSTPCSTPLAVSPPLSKTMGVYLPHPEQYRQVIRALQYLTLTRPDIAFDVNKLAQFMHCATDVHWQATKRLLRYLRGTSAMGLFITKHSSLQLQCFSDSDWAGCPDDRRSTGGYLVYLGNNLISWSSKKQPTVARSSTESEYKAIANVTAEIMWIGSLLYELGVPKALPALLWCDNIGAIYLSSNPIFHARTKHVELDYHFVREQVKLGTLVVRFISSADQLADIMTKPFGTQPEGEQYEDEFGWWLHMNPGNILLGMWPGEIFSGLENAADFIEWGGQVYTPLSDNISPPMGSGTFKNGQYDKSCYMRNVAVWDGNDQSANVDNSYIQKSKPRCYLAGDNSYKDDGYGYSFVFGGTGGKAGEECLD